MASLAHYLYHFLCLAKQASSVLLATAAIDSDFRVRAVAGRESPTLSRMLRCIIFSGRESGVGPVSRVTPVHTALRNCTRDEGRSFEVGNQVLISNHRKLLWSKAMVVNVAEKPEQDSGRYD